MMRSIINLNNIKIIIPEGSYINNQKALFTLFYSPQIAQIYAEKRKAVRK